MIDPITAIGAATAAFNTVKQMVNAGRDLEDTMSALGRWYGAASDLARAEQQRKNPPIFSKIMHSNSIEQEALDILIHKKKLYEQERELETMLNYRFGFGTWKELIELRRKIKKEREDTIYRQMERRKSFIEGLLIVGLSGILIAMIVGLIYLISLSQP